MYKLLASPVFVVLAGCIPFMGNDPGEYQGRGIIAVCTFDMAIVDTCMQ